MGDVIQMQPWLPRTFIDSFNQWETKNWRMWEFGTGFSTPWFAQRVQHIWTMDDSPYWTRAAKNACARKDLGNVTFYTIPRGTDYVSKIGEFPDEFFDFILVDGRDRVQSFLNAFPKVSKIIALDNAFRDRYSEVRLFMDKQLDWTPKLAPWTDEVIRGGEVVPHKKSWDCLVWVKNSESLKYA